MMFIPLVNFYNLNDLGNTINGGELMAKKEVPVTYQQTLGMEIQRAQYHTKDEEPSSIEKQIHQLSNKGKKG